MTDDWNRTIDYLRISVTDLCNFRCIYCMGPEGVVRKRHEDILRFHEIAEIAAAGATCGIRKLRLTGGEPLLRPGLPTLCRMLKEIPGIQELTITTNGSLLPKLAKPLLEAGVDRLNISLDTLNSERFSAITRCGSLNAVLDGIQAAREAGFTHTKLDVVLLGGMNTDEIPAFVALTEAEPICVRFIELMPLRVCEAMNHGSYVSGDCVLTALPELRYEGKDGVAELYRLPGARGTVGLIRPMSRCFCADCSRLRLTSDGNLKPCLHSDVEIPVRGLHGEELKAAFTRAIRAKPVGHRLLEEGRSGTTRDMYEIGG